MSHMLLIGGRTPYKILFARSSGKTFQVEDLSLRSCFLGGPPGVSRAGGASCRSAPVCVLPARSSLPPGELKLKAVMP